MKQINYPNPDVSKNEITYLITSSSVSATTLSVANTADFAVNDYIILESVGNEFCEMRQILTVPSVSSMTITPATSFAHGELAPIKKVFFNQARLWRSIDNITYTMLQTQAVDWQDKWNQITFIDSTGDDSYYYKVEYFNSTTSYSRFSSPIKTQTIIGYMSVEDFKNATGMKGDDSQIAQALLYGAQEIKRRLYTNRQWQAAVTADTNFLVPTDFNGDFGSGLEFADGNLNGVIDKLDFVVYEQDQTGVRTYVTSDIVNIDVDRHMVSFGSPHPTGGKTLVFEYYLTYRKLAELSAKFVRLNLLYATNYIFTMIPFKRLQKGIGGWTINGVTVDFQLGAIQDIMKNNNTIINQLISDIQRVYVRTTRLRQPSGKPMSYIKSTLTFNSDNTPV